MRTIQRQSSGIQSRPTLLRAGAQHQQLRHANYIHEERSWQIEAWNETQGWKFNHSLNTYIGTRHKNPRPTTVVKKAYGIKFMLDDREAIGKAIEHHGAVLKIHEAERLLVPVWLGEANAAGRFSAQGKFAAKGFFSLHHNQFIQTPIMEFSYPFGEHLRPCQILGTHEENHKLLGDCIFGDHIPSMLISREELLEELEEMPVQPRLIPFERCSGAAIDTISKTVDRDLLDKTASKEVRKYYGGMKHITFKYKGMTMEVNQVRPVFLPVYKLKVSAKTHKTQLTTYVCGATGKVSGPVIVVPKRRQYQFSATAFFGTLLPAMFVFEPGIATVGAILSAAGMFQGLYSYREWRAMEHTKAAEREHKMTRLRFGKYDQEGWKWTVEEEEKHEYIYREELRAKAQKRADFEQRVREESGREQAEFNTNKRFRSSQKSRFKKRQRANRNLDPLGYYKILGLEGKESEATAKQIQQAFRVEAQRSHPDLHHGNEDEAKAIMQSVLEAYNVLRDTKLRYDYDNGQLTSNSRRAADTSRK